MPDDAPAASPATGDAAQAPAPDGGHQADRPAGQADGDVAAAGGPRQAAPRRRWFGTHEPSLERLRRSGAQEKGFHAPRVQTWFSLGVASIAILALLPFVTPQWSVQTERLATLGSLVFLVAALGLWLGLGPRAFLVSATLVSLVYLSSAWTAFAFPLQDFFVVGVLVSFAIFTLAGFNLVFVLEEVVYDVHVRLHVRHRLWEAVPTMAVLALAVGLPVWDANGGPSLPGLWIASLAATALLTGWWFLAVTNGLRGRTVVRELHLFTVGILLASGLADLVPLLGDVPALVPSLAAYLVLIGTWVYVTYTTLQRTHFLLKGDDAAPWVAILLGASLAIVAHAQVLFASAGTEAVRELADARLGYLNIGLWLGIAFYVVRSTVRILAYLRDTRGLGARSRHVAGRAARVAGTIEGSERYLTGAAEAVLRRIDHVLPGTEAPPRKPTGWELDDDRLRPL